MLAAAQTGTGRRGGLTGSRGPARTHHRTARGGVHSNADARVSSDKVLLANLPRERRTRKEALPERSCGHSRRQMQGSAGWQQEGALHAEVMRSAAHPRSPRAAACALTRLHCCLPPAMVSCTTVSLLVGMGSPGSCQFCRRACNTGGTRHDMMSPCKPASLPPGPCMHATPRCAWPHGGTPAWPLSPSAHQVGHVCSVQRKLHFIAGSLCRRAQGAPPVVAELEDNGVARPVHTWWGAEGRGRACLFESLLWIFDLQGLPGAVTIRDGGPGGTPAVSHGTQLVCLPRSTCAAACMHVCMIVSTTALCVCHLSCTGTPHPQMPAQARPERSASGRASGRQQTRPQSRARPGRSAGRSRARRAWHRPASVGGMAAGGVEGVAASRTGQGSTKLLRGPRRRRELGRGGELASGSTL